MQQEEYRIYIGTQGWNHANWQGSYYPDDLPGEWALTYYANEIPVVYLPASANWPDKVEQLLDDSHDKFRFLLGISVAQLQDSHVLVALSTMAPRVMGLLVGIAATKEPADVAEGLSALAAYPLCLDFADGVQPSPAWLEFMQQHHINACRYTDKETSVNLPPGLPGKLAVTFAGGDYDAKGLRVLLEDCIKHERDDLTQALILTSTTPSLETIRNGYVIADLL